MNEEFSLRFASSDVRIYAPALEEAKAFSEEEKILFLEYIHDPDIEEDLPFFSPKGWLRRFWGFTTPPLSIWQRTVQLLPEHPTDFRYIPFFLTLLENGAGEQEKVEVLSAPFCTLLSQISRENVKSIPKAVRDQIFAQLDRTYQDISITFAILEVVPLFCAEGVLYQLEVLAREGKATLNMQRVSAAAKIALKRLQENIEEKREADALLRPALAPDEANSLLRPAHDPIETKQEELLRPAEKQKRNE